MGIFVNFEIVDNLFFFFWGRGMGVVWAEVGRLGVCRVVMVVM